MPFKIIRNDLTKMQVDAIVNTEPTATLNRIQRLSINVKIGLTIFISYPFIELYHYYNNLFKKKQPFQ